MTKWSDDLTLAGIVIPRALDVYPPEPPSSRVRHAYGDGPFAALRMPPLPANPGLYVWCADGQPVYAGQILWRAYVGGTHLKLILQHRAMGREIPLKR